MKDLTEQELSAKLEQLYKCLSGEHGDKYIKGVCITVSEFIKLIQSQKELEYKRGFNDGQNSLLDNGQVNLYTEQEAKVYAVAHADMVIGEDYTVPDSHIIPNNASSKAIYGNMLKKEQRGRNK